MVLRDTRGVRSALAMAALSACASLAGAQTPAFNGGTATFQHIPNASATPSPSDLTINVNNPPSSATATSPPSWQISRTNYAYGNANLPGTGTTSAFGWVGHVTNASTAGINFAAGTGVTQVDTGNHISGSSALRLNITQYQWSPSTNFGPFSQGYFSLALQVNVPALSSAAFTATINYKDDLNNNIISTPITFSQTFTGPYNNTVTFTNQKMFYPTSGTPGVVPAARKIRMSGTIEIKAKNDGGPVTIDLQSGEVSSAPPTASFLTGGLWTDSANWSGDIDPLDPGNPIPGGVPNHPGDRARFAGRFPAGEVTIPNVVTIGTFDLDAQFSEPLAILGAAPSSTLQFDTLPGAGPAVMHVGQVNNGNSLADINALVHLVKPLDAIIEGTGRVRINSGVSGAGIKKSGQGTLLIKDANVSTITINEGVVGLGGTANVPGGITVNAGGQLLGTGQINAPVVVNGAAVTIGNAGIATLLTLSSASFNNASLEFNIDSTSH